MTMEKEIVEQVNVADNSGAIHMNSSFQGEKVAGRDYTENHYYEISNPTFSKVQFDIKSGDGLHPVFTKEVLDKVKQYRVILLTEGGSFDSADFGKHLARKIYDETGHYNVYELVQNEENKSLISELQNQPVNSVFLLDGLHPRHIQYDFRRLLQIIESKGCYCIISTGVTKEVWSLNNDLIVPHCYTIPEKDHYNLRELEEWFTNKFRNETPIFLSSEKVISPEMRLSPELTLAHIVKEIPTPQELNLFFAYYKRFNELPSDRILRSTINNLRQSQEEVIHKWFRKLDHRQKVIALCASLFSGMYSNQFFEVVSEVVSNSFWKESSKSLEALDYCDLNFLYVFFKLENVSEGKLLMARSQSVRSAILKVGKEEYQRHLEAALRCFLKVTLTTYKHKTSNWELYGTTQRRAVIRQVFISAARDIGMNEMSNIESVYLELAASGHSHMQGIAAKSLAQFRQFGEEELLFNTLKRWQADKSITDRIKLLLERREQTLSMDGKPIDRVKETSVRTLGYAADYDQPNHLHEEIVRQFLNFAKDETPSVRKTVGEILPKFINHHSLQLKHQLFDDLMPIYGLGEAISEGLKLSYLDYPDDLKKVMTHWIQTITQVASEENRREKFTRRDNSLVSILLTLQKIELMDEKGFSLDELYGYVSLLIQREKRASVIKEVLKLLASIQEKDYQYALESIDACLGSLSKEYRKIIINYWTVQYLKQRKEMEDSPCLIQVGKEMYPAWMKMSSRPLTRIEEGLFIWMNSNSKIAQKYAMLAFLEFAHSFEVQEKHRLWELKIREQERERERRERQTSQSVRYRKAPSAPAEYGIGWWLRIKIFFYLLFESKENKLLLKDILKLYMNSGRYSREELKLVTWKWRTRNRGELSNKLAKWLERLV